MNDLEILQELNLTVFIPREHEEPPPASSFVIALSETEAQFSEAHLAQLSKIMAYLGFAASEYTVCFADTMPKPIPTKLLAFGQSAREATNCTQTHSISAMLENPAIKREVLHAIQTLRRNA